MNIVDKDVVKTSFSDEGSAAILTLLDGFPIESMLSTGPCSIAKLIGSNSTEQFYISAPRMIFYSPMGFCQDFRWDKNSKSSSYRCFWYLRTHYKDAGKDEEAKCDFSEI